MNICSRKKGYALSMLMIALVVISLAIVAAIPVLSMKKDVFTNTSSYVKKCIVSEAAADINSTACQGSIQGIVKDFDKDYESLIYYLSKPASSDAALSLAKAACDEGGEKACNVFLDRCASDNSKCDIVVGSPDTEIRDIAYYMRLPLGVGANQGRAYLEKKGIEYYLQRISNFTNLVDSICAVDLDFTACNVGAQTKTMTYNFNSSQRSDFTESDSLAGTAFVDGKISLTPPDEWAKYYGGNGDDVANSVVASGDYIYVTGSERSNTPGIDEIFVMKLNASDGTAVWKKHYGGAGYEIGKSIAISGGYLYVTGYEDSDLTSNCDMFVMQINTSDGIATWKKKYYTSNSAQTTSIAVSGNDIYVTGNVFGGSLVWDDIFVMKLDATNGTVVWKKYYGGNALNSESGCSVAVSGAYVYVTGYETSDTAGTEDVFVMQLNTSDGTAVWKKHYGGANNDEGDSLVVANGFIYVTGHELSDSVGSNDIFVMKLDLAGTPAWKKHYGGAGNDYDSSIAISGNDIYVTGHELSDTAGSSDILVMKLDGSDGSVSWKNHYGSASLDEGNSIAILGDYIYIAGATGRTFTPMKDPNIIVMKLNTNKTSSNIGGLWTANGVNIGAGWTANGASIKTVDNTASSPWITAGAGTTGGTGIDIKTDTGDVADPWKVTGTFSTGGTGVDIKTVDNTASSPWITGGAGTTGGTGTNMATGWIFDAINIIWDASHFTAGSINGKKSSYFATTNLNHISPIYNGIRTLSASYSEPAGTAIYGLVSFDERASWKKWNSSTSSWVAATSNLSAYVFNSGSANTVAEIQTGLANYKTNSDLSTLDFVFYMESDSPTAVPYIDSVTVNFLIQR